MRHVHSHINLAEALSFWSISSTKSDVTSIVVCLPAYLKETPTSERTQKRVQVPFLFSHIPTLKQLYQDRRVKAALYEERNKKLETSKRINK